jgi:hypothetical protein
MLILAMMPLHTWPQVITFAAGSLRGVHAVLLVKLQSYVLGVEQQQTRA